MQYMVDVAHWLATYSKYSIAPDTPSRKVLAALRRMENTTVALYVRQEWDL
jgi:hypothetical protein